MGTASGDTMFANGSTTYTTTLSNSGAATVTLDGGTATGTYVISATTTLPSSAPVTGTTSGAVTSPASYISQLGAYAGAITSPSAGAVIPSSGMTVNGLASQTFTVFEENAVEKPQTEGDNLTVTTSNSAVALLASSAGAVQNGTVLTLSGNTGSSGLEFDVVGGSTPGTATITITDASNGAVKATSFTVTVGALSSGDLSAANESGAQNASRTTEYFMLPGESTPTSATYASTYTDFGTYNQQTGEFTVTTPALYTETSSSGVATSNTLAVWESASGSYYYVNVSEETPGAGSASSTAYVGITVTSTLGGSVNMAVNGGSYDTNSGTSDSAYIAVATENSSGTWMVAPAETFELQTKVSLPSPGPTLVYPMMIQQP